LDWRAAIDAWERKKREPPFPIEYLVPKPEPKVLRALYLLCRGYAFIARDGQTVPGEPSAVPKELLLSARLAYDPTEYWKPVDAHGVKEEVSALKAAELDSAKKSLLGKIETEWDEREKQLRSSEIKPGSSPEDLDALIKNLSEYLAENQA
jgi:hypothetical protein